MVAVGTLGAGFTFGVIFSSLEDLNDTVDTKTVRHFLIIAWLLFVMAVAVACISAAIFRFLSPKFIKGFNDHGDLVNFVAAGISVVEQLLIVAAFLISARAVRMYDESTGKAAVISISVIGGILVVLWIGMAV